MHIGKWIVLATAVLFTFSASGYENSDKRPAEPLTDIGPFTYAYSYSFIADACGDTDFGKWQREALNAKVEECPFTEAAKKEYYAKAAELTDTALSELIKYFSTHSSMPTHPFNKTKSCIEILANPEMAAAKEQLHQYHLHHISLSDLPSNFQDCDPYGMRTRTGAFGKSPNANAVNR